MPKGTPLPTASFSMCSPSRKWKLLFSESSHRLLCWKHLGFLPWTCGLIATLLWTLRAEVKPTVTGAAGGSWRCALPADLLLLSTSVFAWRAIGLVCERCGVQSVSGHLRWDLHVAVQKLLSHSMPLTCMAALQLDKFLVCVFEHC